MLVEMPAKDRQNASEEESWEFVDMLRTPVQNHSVL